MNVIGLDLSLTSTGIATAEGTHLLRPGKVRGVERLGFIERAIRRMLVASYMTSSGATIVAIEGYSFGSQGRAVFNIGELGGVIRLMLYRDGIPFVEVSPATLKVYATGKGNASKDIVLVAGVKWLGLECGNDEMDAAWLRALVLDKLGEPIVTLPESHRRALEKVELPEGWTDNERGAR